MRANAMGDGEPYLGTIPRAQMVKRDGLLRSIGYLDTDTVGGDTGLWYDEEEEGPMVTPNPKSDRKPQKTPLPQPGPSPEIWGSRSKELLYETLKDKVQEDLNSLELMKSTYGISGALEEVFSNQDILV